MTFTMEKGGRRNVFKRPNNEAGRELNNTGEYVTVEDLKVAGKEGTAVRLQSSPRVNGDESRPSWAESCSSQERG